MVLNQRLKAIPIYVIELAIIALSAVGLYFASSAFEIFEFLHERMLDYDGVPQGHWIQADEVFVVFIFLTFAFGVFAVRRWREARSWPPYGANALRIANRQRPRRSSQPGQERVLSQYVA